MAYEIVIPRLGWSMEEGTFGGWLKKDGDLIRRGDPLFELEDDKAVQEIEAVDEGILRISTTGPKPGSVLKVGAVVGYLVAEGEQIPDDTVSLPTSAPSRSDSPLPPAASPSVRRLARELDVTLSDVDGTGRGGRILSADVHRASSLGTDPKHAMESSSRTHSSNPSTAFASPRARRVAAELGLDWTQLSGTGAGGRIREQDVRAAASRSTSPRAASGNGQRLPVTSRRRVIAQRMVASRQQTVPVTLTTKADATQLVNLRDQFKSAGGSGPIPSYEDMITKLVAEALKRHPLLAGRWDEDAIALPAENGLHLGMAVDTAEGLLVPVLRDVGRLTLREVAEQSRRLVEQARAGTLVAADMQGGVFTITNLGAFGIGAFTPIINLPEAAILGLGVIRREPTVLDDGQIVAQQQLTLSLTFDHRVIDGAPAARFLQTLVNAIINPSAWLLSEQV